jgi:hypothetical protein
MRRKSGTVVYGVAHGTHEGGGVDRRQFLNQLGIAVLTVHCFAANAFASEHAQRDSAPAPDDLRIHSSPGAFSHEHELLIPMAAINAPPPRGVRLVSTKALLHRHPIALTQAELTTVGQGGTVTQKASSHVFVIALAKRSEPRG